MRPHGRPKGEFPPGGTARSAKGAPVTPHGRPNGEFPPGGTARSAEGAPLSPGQIQLVQSTWQQVLPIRAAAADLFYGRLFELAPDTRPLFQRDIHAQGAMLMATLDAVVRSLEDLGAVLPTARQLAQRHVVYGVQPRHYDSVGTALLWTLEQGLGAAMTPAARAAWQQAYAVLAGVMKEAAYPAGAAGEASAPGPARQSAPP